MTLYRCPFCGSDKGYELEDGDTYRWWAVFCSCCGEQVAICTSDRRTSIGSELPKQWPAADAAWNESARYANALRDLIIEIDLLIGHDENVTEWRNKAAELLYPTRQTP